MESTALNARTADRIFGSGMDHRMIDVFLEYPFAEDEAYQQGLKNILASGVLDGKSEEEKAHFMLESQVFYFNRITHSSVTPEDVHMFRLSSGSVISAPDISMRPTVLQPSSSPDTTYASQTRALSFAELQELIEQGKTDQIPNNKVIPDGLNPASPSESRTPAPKKPWEQYAKSDG